MKKILSTFIIAILLILPVSNYKVLAQTTSATGFVSGNIWYSKTDFVEDESIKIYTGFWNGEGSQITVNIDFYDKEVLLGSRELVVPALTLKDVSITWKVTSGTHQISAKISKATSSVNGASQNIALAKNEVETPSIFVPKKIEPISPTAELNKVSEKVVDKLPESIAKPLTNTATAVDTFRENTATTLEKKVDEAKKEIAVIENKTVEPANTDTAGTPNASESSDEGTTSVDEKTEETVADDATVATAEELEQAPEILKSTKSNASKIKESTKGVAPKVKTPVSGMARAFAYAKLFILKIALFIFAHSWIFYTLIIFIIFFFIKFLLKRFRRKRKYNKKQVRE